MFQNDSIIQSREHAIRWLRHVLHLFLYAGIFGIVYSMLAESGHVNTQSNLKKDSISKSTTSYHSSIIIKPLVDSNLQHPDVKNESVHISLPPFTVIFAQFELLYEMISPHSSPSLFDKFIYKGQRVRGPPVSVSFLICPPAAHALSNHSNQHFNSYKTKSIYELSWLIGMRRIYVQSQI